ncbi:MAG TPA: hypothetical protein VF781_02300 [Solirubrobacteraceae bacterium]
MAAGPGREEDFWPWPGRFGVGLVLDCEVVVEAELDPGLGLEPVVLEEVELGEVGLEEVVLDDDEVTVGRGTVGVVVDEELVVHD